MKSKISPPLIALALLALFIWLRNTSWMSTADDTLPILVTLPLVYYLGQPWNFLETPRTTSMSWIGIGTLLMVIGLALEATLAMALGWTALLWAYLSCRVPEKQLPSLRKLMVLPIMAFPWIALDADTLGWWFRLSGSATAAWIFDITGFAVTREGTQLFISGIPISVEAACAGLNTLQSMLIAGSVGAFIVLEHTNRFWFNLPLLAVMAWLSNTIRIVVLILAALIVSPEFALGPFHDFGGWLVLVIMFALCWAIFTIQEPKESTTSLDQQES